MRTLIAEAGRKLRAATRDDRWKRFITHTDIHLRIRTLIAEAGRKLRAATRDDRTEKIAIDLTWPFLHSGPAGFSSLRSSRVLMFRGPSKKTRYSILKTCENMCGLGASVGDMASCRRDICS
jgi:hypothetical protein